jgi:hypothetical protein
MRESSEIYAMRSLKKKQQHHYDIAALKIRFFDLVFRFA